MEKKKISVISIVFYAIALLIVVYVGLSIADSTRTVSEAIDAGQISWSKNFFEILNFYMANGLNQLFPAIIVAGIGWLIQLNTAKKVVAAASAVTSDNDEDDEDNEQASDEESETTDEE